MQSAENPEFDKLLQQVLPTIDQYLADTPVVNRPFPATITFVQDFVVAAGDESTPKAEPGTPEEFVSTKWFAALHARIRAWYHSRYPGLMKQKYDGRILGIVMIAGTVFAIRIPAMISRPGRPGETMWLSIPDGLRDGEKVLNWVENPPNYAMLSRKEYFDAERFATEVANSLRSIRAGIAGVVIGKNDNLNGFVAGIMTRLHQAAELLLDSKPISIQYAYWELQMACEVVLKALQIQLTNDFTETHDLFDLYDKVKNASMGPAPKFKRHLLKRLPRWKEAVDLRYGHGNRDDRTDCAKSYRAALSIVAGAVQSMETRYRIGSARFEMAKPPWLAYADE